MGIRNERNNRLPIQILPAFFAPFESSNSKSMRMEKRMMKFQKDDITKLCTSSSVVEQTSARQEVLLSFVGLLSLPQEYFHKHYCFEKQGCEGVDVTNRCSELVEEFSAQPSSDFIGVRTQFPFIAITKSVEKCRIRGMNETSGKEEVGRQEWGGRHKDKVEGDEEGEHLLIRLSSPSLSCIFWVFLSFLVVQMNFLDSPTVITLLSRVFSVLREFHSNVGFFHSSLFHDLDSNLFFLFMIIRRGLFSGFIPFSILHKRCQRYKTQGTKMKVL